MSGVGHSARRHPVGEGEPPPQPVALSWQEARDAEFSRVMAQHARLTADIRTLKKLLWREVARHRRAHRYTNAKDIEIALNRMDTHPAP